MASCVMAARPQVRQPDTLALNAVVDKYTQRLMLLVGQNRTRTADHSLRLATPYYRMFAPATLYSDALRQEMSGLDWHPTLPGKVQVLEPLDAGADSYRAMWQESNRMLMLTYIRQPWLVTTTEQEVAAAGGLQKALEPELPHNVRLVENEIQFDLNEDVEPVDLKVKRPNFWKFTGNYALQFTQSHFSDNWYQGGEDNYTLLALATMEANFNNKQRVQWDNKLEMRLGFQTSKSDEKHKFKTNDDLLRITSKIGFKATKRWFYTLQVQAYTQFYPSYNANSEVVKSDILSPFNLVVSLGMDYKLELKRFKGSANLSPVAYNFRSVQRRSLFGNFGLDPGRSMYNNFGPNITVNFSWDIWKNIRWDSRIYWFSNLEMTDIEWENTLTFSLTKYINARLFLYPRIDDSSPKYRNEDKGSYLMFKEWFSLGLNYSF